MIFHDKWKPYDRLDLEGYKHYGVNHSERFAVPMIDDETGEFVMMHTNEIEGLWHHAKEYLRHRYGVTRQRFGFYLGEIVFHRVNRTDDEKRKQFFETLKTMFPLDKSPSKLYANGLTPETVCEIRRERLLGQIEQSAGFEKYENMNLVNLEEILNMGSMLVTLRMARSFTSLMMNGKKEEN